MDAMTADFEANSFDVIYSRDTILHIEQKEELFKLCLVSVELLMLGLANQSNKTQMIILDSILFQKWLKPGGKLLISDYCCGVNIDNEEFKSYVRQRNYFLLDPSSYGKVTAYKTFRITKIINIEI